MLQTGASKQISELSLQTVVLLTDYKLADIVCLCPPKALWEVSGGFPADVPVCAAE